MNYVVRTMAHQDGPAIKLLDETIPGSGTSSVIYRYLFDPYEVMMALHPGAMAVVAEDPSDGSIAGMAFMSMHTGRFQGEIRPFGHIYGLVVHPNHRRRGLATTIYMKLLENARKAGGPETMIVATIQENNEGSLRAAKTWATQIVPGRIRVVSARMTSTSPKIPRGLIVRTAVENDWSTIVGNLNAFYSTAEFYKARTAQDSAEYHARRPFGFQLRDYLVATDEKGAILAGAGVVFDGLVRTGIFPSLHGLPKLINSIRHQVPSQGVLKRISLRELWHVSGREDAARALWRSATWMLRDRGNRLISVLDSKGPLADILPKEPFQPFTGGYLALASDHPLDQSRNLYLLP